MDIYQELGVPGFINARAPHTRFGGAIMPPAVVEAMVAASRRGTIMAELQEKVGQAIARLTQNEAAYVSCGAASGITLTMAACMAGTDASLSDRLPDTTGMKNQVVMHACDRGTECDVAIRCAGATITSIGDMEQDEAETLGRQTRQADYIVGQTRDLPGVTVQRSGATQVEIWFDATAMGMDYCAAADWFLRTDPALLLGYSSQGLRLNTAPLEAGDEQIVAEKLRQFFLQRAVEEKNPLGVRSV